MKSISGLVINRQWEIVSILSAFLFRNARDHIRSCSDATYDTVLGYNLDTGTRPSSGHIRSGGGRAPHAPLTIHHAAGSSGDSSTETGDLAVGVVWYLPAGDVPARPGPIGARR